MKGLYVMVWGLGFRVKGLGCGAEGLVFRVKDLPRNPRRRGSGPSHIARGCASGCAPAGFRVQGLEFRF